MLTSHVNIAGASLNQTPIHWKNNFENICEAIKKAKNENVNILCLPELAITGYGCEDLFLTDWVKQKAMDILFEIVPLTSQIAIAVGLPIQFENKTYNALCFIADGIIKGFYLKQKLARTGIHYEPRWFENWQKTQKKSIELRNKTYPIGHIIVEYEGIKIAFEICEDAWNTDRPALALKEKVDVILNPSASHFAFGKSKFREQLVIQSSKLLNCIYLYSNLLGNEAGRVIYDGDIIIAQKGKLIGKNRRFSFKNVQLFSVTTSIKKTVSPIHVCQDFETPNEEFSQVAPLALFDYLRKSASKGFVLSLSGGADSSAVATLVSLMVKNGLGELGKESFEQKIGISLKATSEKGITQQLLTTVYQATQNSSDETFVSAKKLSEDLGSKFYHWNIDDLIHTYQKTIEHAIERPLTWEVDDTVLQNIQARTRSPIIWMLANLNKALLLATSNRSEGAVGYATMDGDTSGSIAPLAGVSKSFILQWLQYAEHSIGVKGLKYVNRLVPTAELRPPARQQTDESDLMPYDILLKIEQEAIINKKSPQQIYETINNEVDGEQLKVYIKKFFLLWSRNQWKRERYAPSFHFDDYNIDPRSYYRFPILSGNFTEELAMLSPYE